MALSQGIHNYTLVIRYTVTASTASAKNTCVLCIIGCNVCDMYVSEESLNPMEGI